jgi:transcriptional regulator with XRE-family HTH domain
MSETVHKIQVGRRLRAAIEALGLSQTDVANLLDTAPSKLGNWLRGDNYPSEWFIKRFCDRYGVTTDWIYRGIVTGMPSLLADRLWKFEKTTLPEEAAEILQTPPRPTRPKGPEPPHPTVRGGRQGKPGRR